MVSDNTRNAEPPPNQYQRSGYGPKVNLLNSHRDSIVCPSSVLTLEPPAGVLCVPALRSRPSRIQKQEVTLLSLALAEPARIDSVELLNDPAGQPSNRIRVAPAHIAPYYMVLHGQGVRPLGCRDSWTAPLSARTSSPTSFAAGPSRPAAECLSSTSRLSLHPTRADGCQERLVVPVVLVCV